MRDRFWTKVEQHGDCWLWAGALDRAGYGRFRAPDGHSVLAHRYAYEQLRAEIPAGLVIDHLCRTPACVNPWHLEPVTNHVNVQRGQSGARYAQRTRCPHEHAYTPENTYIIPGSGARCCRTCKREESRRRFRKSA